MHKGASGARSEPSRTIVFLKRAWTTIASFVLAALTLAAGAYCASQPEWGARSDVKLYNDGVKAYAAPPGTLPASDWRPAEGPIERTTACFERAAAETKDVKLKAIALYNVGTIVGREAFAFSAMSISRVGVGTGVAKLVESVRIDPNDEDAKYNLEVLERMLVAGEEQPAGQGPGYAPGSIQKGF